MKFKERLRVGASSSSRRIGTLVIGCLLLVSLEALAISRSRPYQISQTSHECWATSTAVFNYAVGRLTVPSGQSVTQTLRYEEARVIGSLLQVGCVDRVDALVNSKHCLAEYARIMKLRQTYQTSNTVSLRTLEPLLNRSHVIMMYQDPRWSEGHTVVIYHADTTSFCMMDPLVGVRQCHKYSAFRAQGAIGFFTR